MPALGDRCAVYGHGGDSRVVGARAAGPDAHAAEAAIRASSAPELRENARLLGAAELEPLGAGSGALLALQIGRAHV